MPDRNVAQAATSGLVARYADHIPVGASILSTYHLAMPAAEVCSAPDVLVSSPPFGPSPRCLAWPSAVPLGTFAGLVTGTSL